MNLKRMKNDLDIKLLAVILALLLWIIKQKLGK